MYGSPLIVYISIRYVPWVFEVVSNAESTLTLYRLYIFRLRVNIPSEVKSRSEATTSPVC